MELKAHIDWLVLHQELLLASGENDALRKAFIAKVRNYLKAYPEIEVQARAELNDAPEYASRFFASFYQYAFFDDSLNELILLLQRALEGPVDWMFLWASAGHSSNHGWTT
ncbi:hypothetical protein L0P88_21895 [Muricauda sp. SCSIO 64092]|uniref:hypothetical protein n=1 Tax=Allomuricauda sp. SCSIO 64092 TaxID=2908842 RepID=UPI001FF2B7BC|nr:hypothetical protein [Muricauda sp. SCSIO 64092]UOY06562.1 hypothetical protein L0P88_21895 [Muricauda sp. SCSIO 64092]